MRPVIPPTVFVMFPLGVVGGIDLVADLISKYGQLGCERRFNG